MPSPQVEAYRSPLPPAPAKVVFERRVRPGTDAAFKAWSQRSRRNASPSEYSDIKTGMKTLVHSCRQAITGHAAGQLEDDVGNAGRRS